MPFTLLAVSDRASLGEDRLPGWIGQLAAAGVDGLMLREKDLADRALYALTRLARSLFLPASGRLLVNGRLDVALAAGADGAHLPGDGVPLAALRQRFGPRPLLGRSTHRLEEVAEARDAGADYVVFGPVYSTPGKAPGEGQGLAGLERAAAQGLPVYALGGVTLERLAEVAAAGAAGAAGIRLFQEIGRLPELVQAAAQVFPRRPGAPNALSPGDTLQP